MHKNKMNKNNLKVGDRVLVTNRYGRALKTIQRETKLYWIIDSRKYNKDSLHCAGDSMWAECIKPITEEEEKTLSQEFKQHNLAVEVSKLDFSCLSIEQLDFIKSMIEGEKKNGRK